MEGKEEGLNIIAPPKIIIMNKISCLTSITISCTLGMTMGHLLLITYEKSPVCG